MQEAMKGMEQRIEAKIAEIGFDINKHTTQTSKFCSISINKHVIQRIDMPTATFMYQ
jgi:hypothetical protein